MQNEGVMDTSKLKGKQNVSEIFSHHARKHLIFPDESLFILEKKQHLQHSVNLVNLP